MGKNLKGKELGAGISQRKDGRYSARFVTSSGKRIEKYFPMLQDARKWLAEAKLNDENGSVGVSVGMTVDAWFEFWIVNIKDKTVRYNTARNYRERYRQNIKKHIGKMLMIDVSTDIRPGSGAWDRRRPSTDFGRFRLRRQTGRCFLK